MIGLRIAAIILSTISLISATWTMHLIRQTHHAHQRTQKALTRITAARNPH